MRPSKKDDILRAALHLLGERGAAGLTYDALAQQTGMTKGGLLYHFPTKEALVDAVVAHLWSVWDRTTAANLGVPEADADLAQRLMAEIRTTLGDSVDLAELAAFVDFMRDPRHRASYAGRRARWFDVDQLSTDQRLAYLAADGLWLGEATGTVTLDPAQRAVVVERILELAGGSSTS